VRYNTIIRMTFKEKVYAFVRSIPRGKTMTYMQVARAAGSPRAFRAVGNILTNNKEKPRLCRVFL
jgi:methylated-DNA-protein-cysteine methyltransferase-like protein